MKTDQENSCNQKKGSLAEPLLQKAADMIVDCSAGVVVKIFVPHKVYYHIISQHPAGIHDKQSKDVKLFHCQHGLGLANIYQSVSKQKCKSSAWTSVNLAAGVTGIV